MKFIINRASGDTKPHPKAIYNNEINYYEIEIETVEELVGLDDEGVVIMPDYKDGTPLLTIYDDYIE